MDNVETKSLSGFEIKDADQGEVTAIVSTFNVVDRDGDVILPGAIKDGTSVKLSAYNHDVITEKKAPVGTGVIRVKGNQAVLEARYYMTTQRGRDAFAQVKEMGTDSEWSIGFPKNVQTKPMTDTWSAKGARRLISGINPIESSPVFIGANQYTHTVAVKGTEIEPAPQADGDGTEIDAKAIGEQVLREIADRIQAEQSAAADAAAAREAAEVETKAKAAAEAEAARKAAELDAATKEYERFQRNLRRSA